MNRLKSFIGKIGANMPSGSPPPAAGGSVIGLVVLGGCGYAAYQSAMTITPGHLGLVYNRWDGLNDKVSLKPGLNFIIPWFQRAIIYDIRTRAQPIDTQSGSKDLQMVQISLKILFKPDPNELPFIYRKLGKDYDARVLPSIVNEVTKAVVAQYNASELLTKREIVSTHIRTLLVDRARDFKILLDDVAITHLAFSKEYTAAVEAKQVAQQDSERAKYIVERALFEKKSIVIKAQGEAKSAELIGNAIKNNPAFVQLRKIEASREIASTLVTSGNKVYLNADSLMINTLGQAAEGEASGKGKAEAAKKGWLG